MYAYRLASSQLAGSNRGAGGGGNLPGGLAVRAGPPVGREGPAAAQRPPAHPWEADGGCQRQAKAREAGLWHHLHPPQVSLPSHPLFSPGICKVHGAMTPPVCLSAA